jgi:hypothetical protein
MIAAFVVWPADNGLNGAAPPLLPTLALEALRDAEEKALAGRFVVYDSGNPIRDPDDGPMIALPGKDVATGAFVRSNVVPADPFGPRAAGERIVVNGVEYTYLPRFDWRHHRQIGHILASLLSGLLGALFGAFLAGLRRQRDVA